MAALLVSGALSGCPQPGSHDDGGDPADSQLLWVGTGASNYQPLQDGDAVDVVRGPQGGFHIWGAVRIRPPLDPKQLTISYRVLENGTRTELSAIGYRRDLVPNETFFEAAGLVGALDEPVSGQAVILRMEVTDSQQRRAHDERRVVVRGP